MSFLKLLVCPHDTTTNPIRWQIFTQYLAQRLSVHIRFDMMLDFQDFHEHMDSADIVYANPLDTLHLIEQRNFVALAHPANVYDEAVFIANHDVVAASIESLHNQRIASVQRMLPTKIALNFLNKQGIAPSEIVNCNSWTSVMSSVWRKETCFGIVYKDTYQELSEQGKHMVNAFYTTHEQVAFHNILVGNNGLDKRQKISRILQDMDREEEGIELLHELNFGQWVITKQEELAAIKQIVDLYG